MGGKTGRFSSIAKGKRSKTLVSTPDYMWDKIAKAGTYTDMYGKEYTFTAEDFREIAANYAKAEEKAPLVLGHPDTDSPAYGWVGALRAAGEYLEAEYEKVSETVKDAVDNGQYRYKSISLFHDLKRLKHVGLLGAVPPAMSGLGAVRFGAGESVVLSFAENIKTGANKVNPEELLAQIAKLQEEIGKLKEDLSKLAAAKGAAEERATEAEANFAAFKKDVSLKARTARVDALIAEGRLEPGKKDEVLKIAEKLSDGAPAFATGNLEDTYLKTFESRDPSPLLSAFSAPAAGDREPCSPRDIVNKL